MNSRLFLAAWLAGLPGVVVMTWRVVPVLLKDKALPVPLWVATTASAVQSAVLVAIAAAAGAALAARLGLQAPVLAALSGAQPLGAALAPQLVPGLVGGALGALIVFGFTRYAPAPLAALQVKLSVPMSVRLLYGGVTEEVLIRFGLMTLIAWLLWRYAQGGVGPPTAWIVASAIAVSAVLFGVGHLPAASALLGGLSNRLRAYIVAGNALFGLLAGYLYWRYGLESAVIAHALAHAGSALLAHFRT